MQMSFATATRVMKLPRTTHKRGQAVANHFDIGGSKLAELPFTWR